MNEVEGPEKLARLIEEELTEIPKGSLKPETKLREAIELTSLNMLMLVSLILEEYGVRLNKTEVLSCEILADLHKLATEKQTD